MTAFVKEVPAVSAERYAQMLQTEEGAAADDQKYVAAEANTPQREAKAFECDAGAATSSEASGKKNEEAATAGGRHG